MYCIAGRSTYTTRLNENADDHDAATWSYEERYAFEHAALVDKPQSKWDTQVKQRTIHDTDTWSWGVSHY